VAVASAPAPQASSPPATTSRSLAGETFLAPGAPAAGIAVRPQRPTRPPARAILLEKHILIL